MSDSKSDPGDSPSPAPEQPAGPPVTFESLGLSAEVLAGVQAEGFTEPRPIQASALPPGLLGRDVLGLARTGTGKTAAFALPILERVHARGDRGEGRAPLALVLAPTRELGGQIAGDIRRLGAEVGVTVALVIGGVDPGRQAEELGAGVDVVVASAGRLLDLARGGRLDLGSVEILVLDEADRMVDMGFLPDVRRILERVPVERQTLMFSATMPPELQALAQRHLREPEILDLGHTMPAETIDHSAILVRGSAKMKLLKAILASEDFRSAIVFVRTKQRAKAVSFALQKRGASAELLHGDKKQGARTRALERFKSGEVEVLVATDLASRGLDVEAVSHVINYDIPTDPDTYVHRIGRTGRAERSGIALTFISEGDLDDLRAVEHRIGMRLPRTRIDGFADLDIEDLAERRRERASRHSRPRRRR